MGYDRRNVVVVFDYPAEFFEGDGVWWQMMLARFDTVVEVHT